MILRFNENKIGIVEATGGVGVGLSTWDRFIKFDWQKYYYKFK